MWNKTDHDCPHDYSAYAHAECEECGYNFFTAPKRASCCWKCASEELKEWWNKENEQRL